MAKRLPWCGLLGSLAVLAVACGSRPAPSPGPDAARRAATTRRTPSRAAARRAPARRRISLGGGCRCELPPAGPSNIKARRKDLVRRMDTLNQGLRTHVAALDRAIPDEVKGRILQPASLRRGRRLLVCRLDCTLYLLVPGSSGTAHGGKGKRAPGRADARPIEPTDALWSYLEAVALLLDTAKALTDRLAAPPARRPRSPSLERLTRLFNRTARISNESIGLELLRRSLTPTRMDLDSSSFGVKTRRWRRKLTGLLASFRRRWLPLPALSRPSRLRVALARLRVALLHLLPRAKAIRCGRGARCTALQQRWLATLKAAEELSGRIERTVSELRSSWPAPAPPQQKRLGGAMEASILAALRRARGQ